MRVGRVEVVVDEGAGPIVVLGHGAGSSALFLEEAFGPALRAAGWRLAAVDLAGHGASPPAATVVEHHLDRHAEDLAAVCLALDAAVVGGVSLGGMAAVRAVGQGLNVRAVVALIPAWSGTSGSVVHAFIADEVRRDGVDGMVQRLESDTSLPEWIRDVVVRDYKRHDPASLGAVLMSLDRGEGPTLDEVAGLRVPLGLVGWPDDPGHPLEVAEQWARLAPTAALAITSIERMQDDRGAMGKAVLDVLGRLGIRP